MSLVGNQPWKLIPLILVITASCHDKKKLLFGIWKRIGSRLSLPVLKNESATFLYAGTNWNQISKFSAKGLALWPLAGTAKRKREEILIIRLNSFLFSSRHWGFSTRHLERVGKVRFRITPYLQNCFFVT